MKAVDGISLEIEEGEIFGLLGPNGAGKITTISMITTLLKPDSGEIEIFGENAVANPDQVKQFIGIVPQEIIVYEDLTLNENLDFCEVLYGVDDHHALSR